MPSFLLTRRSPRSIGYSISANRPAAGNSNRTNEAGTGNAPSTTQRVINVVATDGSGNSNTAVATVDVTAVNDAPTGADATLTTNEDAPLDVAPPTIVRINTQSTLRVQDGQTRVAYRKATSSPQGMMETILFVTATADDGAQAGQ